MHRGRGSCGGCAPSPGRCPGGASLRTGTPAVSETTPPRRIACVMVGADLGRPPTSNSWEAAINAFTRTQLAFPLQLELHYSSFADLGMAIDACGRDSPGWSEYAADVNAQLRRKGLLGYE